jgi:glyoxylase-like metal-dependent hydrolase (beta-lactamase superfamily II)
MLAIAGEPLVASLAQLGLDVADVDTVVLSHLHFDHAGGGTHLDDAGQLVPTFPNATYVVGRIEWEDATSGAPELRGSYPLENILPLEKSGRLRLIDDGETIVPGITAERTGGHTLGHQMIVIESGGAHAAYVGDICPTHWHMPSHWCMGYDMYLRETRICKPRILGRAADEAWLLLWAHDPNMAAARIARDAKREFVVDEPFATL